MKKIIIIFTAIFIAVIVLWYSDIKVYNFSLKRTIAVEKNLNQPKTTTRTETGLTDKTNSQQKIWSGWKSGDKLNIEDAETIKRYMDVLMHELSEGSLDKALFLYRKIIELSYNSPIFTGGEIENNELVNKLKLIEKRLKDTQDPIVLSTLFLDKGITEYDIGNYLYYSDAKKYQLAIIYHWLLAAESLKQSNELHNNAVAHRYEWLVIMDIGSPAKFAIEELNNAVLLDNQDAISYYKLWNAYRQTKQYNLAIESYRRGIQIDNKHEFMRLNLWITYFDNGNRKEGYQTYKDLLEICKDYCHIVNFNMANALRTDEKYDDAMIFLDRAIEFAKLKMVVYRNAYREKGKALYLLNNTEALWHLKMSLNDSNDPAHYDNNFNQNDNERGTYYYIGKVCIALKDYDNAKMYLDKANILFPWDEELIKLRDSIKYYASK